MTTFTREWIDPVFHMSPLLFFLILQMAAIAGEYRSKSIKRLLKKMWGVVGCKRNRRGKLGD